MPANKKNHSPPPEEVISFLKKTLPFNDLDRQKLVAIAGRCLIDFFPKGTLIFEQTLTDVDYLYLIQKGGVKSYLKDDDGEITLKDFRGEGEYFGALPIIRETRANLNVETVEDTFCFLLDKKIFLELIRTETRVAQYFLRSMTEKLAKTAYTELRQHKLLPRTEGSLVLFNSQVGDFIKGKPRIIKAADTVQQAAISMARLHIGSLLVNDANGKIIGIVTDKDMRTKVVAEGLEFSIPVERIMTSPVIKVPAHTIGFDALIVMMRNRIHHLAVENNGEITGVITTHDIMVLQGTSPLYLFREIMAQRHIEGLYAISQKVPKVVRTLIEEGAKANNITRMITVLNDHILERLLTLLIAEMGAPPVPFCWMLMGSEGRREQTFKTDQDNALIYEDVEESQQAEVEEYFRTFGEAAIEHLVKCGYPRCPGDIMASNPKWRRPFSKWRSLFDSWLNTPEPEKVLHSTIFFDFRAGFGERRLAADLRNHLATEAQKQDIFLHHLAKDCLEVRPPLTFFRNFIVEKDGEHRNRLDLKTSGLVPFVDFARLLALKHGIKESNTLGRLQILHERRYMSDNAYTESIEAYEFLMHLRLVHQMHMMEQDEIPDNYINPADLSDLEKQTLKEAFEVIRRLQSFIKMEFRVSEA